MANSKKAEYRQLIEDSPLFGLDREKDYIAYERESKRMIGYLFSYLTTGKKGEEYMNYGMEIYDTASRCIKNYDTSKGTFLAYFEKAWKLEYGHAKGSEKAEEESHGMKVSRDDWRAVQKFRRLYDQIDRPCSVAQKIRQVAESMHEMVEYVTRLWELDNTKFISGNSSQGGDEEGPEVFENIAAPEPGIATEENEAAEGILAVIERLYQRVQERQKPILSDLVTTYILKKEYALTSEHAEALSFVNREIWEDFIAGKPLPTQRDIANKYGREESSVSRTWKSFAKKVREELEKEGI